MKWFNNALSSKIVKDPLTHFIFIGTLFFLLKSNIPSENTMEFIAPDKMHIKQAEKELTTRLGRQPTEQELDNFFAEKIDKAILYQKGLELGIDRNDELIRNRVIKKTELILRDLASVTDPTEEQLRQYFANHQSQYLKSGIYSFEALSLIPNQLPSQAITLQNRLNRDEASVLHDFHAFYHFYNRRKPAGLKVTFNSSFVSWLDTIEMETWQHFEMDDRIVFTKLTHRSPAAPRAFKEIEKTVRADWHKAQQNTYLETLLSTERGRYY